VTPSQPEHIIILDGDDELATYALMFDADRNCRYRKTIFWVTLALLWLFDFDFVTGDRQGIFFWLSHLTHHQPRCKGNKPEQPRESEDTDRGGPVAEESERIVPEHAVHGESVVEPALEVDAVPSVAFAIPVCYAIMFT
jgi:hypothetical protein